MGHGLGASVCRPGNFVPVSRLRIAVFAVLSYFIAGADLIRWEVLAVEPQGPYRLTMHHPHGVIVEYFRDAGAALGRERELEALLIAARTDVRTAQAGAWR